MLVEAKTAVNNILTGLSGHVVRVTRNTTSPM